MKMRSQESGAALVEMAVILPLLVLLLFGVIEASWAFAQANDVRHGAREGARLAAVEALTGEVEKMAVDLHLDLEKKRWAKPAAQ